MLVLPLLVALAGPIHPHATSERGLVVRVDSAKHTVPVSQFE